MGCTGSRRSGRTSGREDHPLPAGQLAALALKGTPVYSWPPWPLEGTPDVYKRQVDVRACVRRTVHHQRDVDVLKVSGLKHVDLAAEGLLRGGAVDHQVKGKGFAAVFQCHRGPEACGPLHVVTAAMAQVF